METKNSNYLILKIEKGIIEAENKEIASIMIEQGNTNWTSVDEAACSVDNEFYEKIKSLTIQKIFELLDKEKRSITWSVDDFKVRAIDLENSGIYIKYDESKFKNALEEMISRHEPSIGISWDIIDWYLHEVCRSEFNKMWGHIWKELTPKGVEKYWESKTIFGFKLDGDIDSLINKKGVEFNPEILEEYDHIFLEIDDQI